MSSPYKPLQNKKHQNFNKIVNQYEDALQPFAKLIQVCAGKSDEKILIQAKHVCITVADIKKANEALGLNVVFIARTGGKIG